MLDVIDNKAAALIQYVGIAIATDVVLVQSDEFWGKASFPLRFAIALNLVLLLASALSSLFCIFIIGPHQPKWKQQIEFLISKYNLNNSMTDEDLNIEKDDMPSIHSLVTDALVFREVSYVVSHYLAIVATAIALLTVLCHFLAA